MNYSERRDFWNRNSESRCAVTLPTVKDYINFVRTSAGPVVQIVKSMDPATAEAAWDDMENALGRYERPDGWEGPDELLLTAARRP